MPTHFFVNVSLSLSPTFFSINKFTKAHVIQRWLLFKFCALENKKNFPTDHIFNSIQSKRKSFINFLTCSIELFFFWFGECCRTMRNKVKSLCNWIWIFDYIWNRVTKNSAQKWKKWLKTFQKCFLSKIEWKNIKIHIFSFYFHVRVPLEKKEKEGMGTLSLLSLIHIWRCRRRG